MFNLKQGVLLSSQISLTNHVQPIRTIGGLTDVLMGTGEIIIDMEALLVGDLSRAFLPGEYLAPKVVTEWLCLSCKRANAVERTDCFGCGSPRTFLLG